MKPTPPPQKTETSLNPAPGSNPTELERRRLPRIVVTAEQFKLAQNGKIYGVSDLSLDGMRLRLIDPSEAHQFPVGSALKGTINLKGKKLELSARVKHLYATGIGCQFEAPSAELKAELTRLLDPVSLGKELHAIPSSEAGTTWFHGPSGTDLVLKRAGGSDFTQALLTTLGRYVQWNRDSGIETGWIAPLTDVSAREDARASELGLVRFETLSLTPDARPDSEKLRIAKTVVLSSNLPQDLKKWCETILAP